MMQKNPSLIFLILISLLVAVQTVRFHGPHGYKVSSQQILSKFQSGQTYLVRIRMLRNMSLAIRQVQDNLTEIDEIEQGRQGIWFMTHIRNGLYTFMSLTSRRRLACPRPPEIGSPAIMVDRQNATDYQSFWITSSPNGGVLIRCTGSNLAGLAVRRIVKNQPVILGSMTQWTHNNQWNITLLE